MNENGIITMTHGSTYKWPRGVCLEAEQDVELMFPGVLIEQHELFGDIMEVSDPKTKVGLVSCEKGEGFESINVVLRAKDWLRVKKDTETVITFNSPSPSTFRKR